MECAWVNGFVRIFEFLIENLSRYASVNLQISIRILNWRPYVFFLSVSLFSLIQSYWKSESHLSVLEETKYTSRLITWRTWYINFCCLVIDAQVDSRIMFTSRTNWKTTEVWSVLFAIFSYWTIFIIFVLNNGHGQEQSWAKMNCNYMIIKCSAVNFEW